MTLFTSIHKRSNCVPIADVFDRLATSNIRCLLDSCSKGRFTIAAWDPLLTLKLEHGRTSLDCNSEMLSYERLQHLRELVPTCRFLEAVDQVLDFLFCEVSVSNTELSFPLADSLIGYLGYELAWEIEKLPPIEANTFPDAHLFFPERAIIVDESDNSTYVLVHAVSQEAAQLALNELVSKLDEVQPTTAAEVIEQELHRSTESLLDDWTADWTKQEYINRVARTQSYIAAGDIFQANLSQGFRAPFQGAPFEFYRLLRTVNPAPYAAFLEVGNTAILSVSPELFVEWEDGFIMTRPIKGTQKRGTNVVEDLWFRDALASSEKDKAELVMIVDVERNDFHRFCRVGSVKVPELFALEAHPTIWHQHATVTGHFDKNCVTAGQILQSIFPGGSITGAPKIRAMEIIHELEGHRRNVYTGAIGYVSPRASATWNIPIRTMTIVNDEISFRVGGGITWYSDTQLEYEETLSKGRGMMLAYALWKKQLNRTGIL